MVVKIQKASSAITPSVMYNEQKVIANEADILFVNNMRDDGADTILETLQSYAFNNAIDQRTKNISFHMSVNPGDEDKTTETQAKEFIKELMAELGYENQPYAVYRHRDIDRGHYHIVSVRVDKEGKAISAKNDRRVALNFLWKTAMKYGFTVGSMGHKKEKEYENGYRFNLANGRTMEQYSYLFHVALQYDYRNFNDFQCVMRSLGIKVSHRKNSGEEKMYFQGLNFKGNPCTRPVCETEFDRSATYRYTNALEEHVEFDQDDKKARSRVTAYVAVCAEHSGSRKEFLDMLHKHGIDGYFTEKDGRISGLTLVDRESESVFHGNTLSQKFSMASIVEKEDNGSWEKPQNSEDRGTVFQENEQESQEEEQDEAYKLGQDAIEMFSAMVASAQGKQKKEKKKKKKDSELTI